MATLIARRQLWRIQVISIRPQRRCFFGMGEILGVLTNPAETLRQLKESKDMLQKAKEETELHNEAKKIPPKHTFSKLPGFHGRKVEQELLRKVLSNTPKLTVVFGATSVGKTALLREVLATEDFFVVKFDLRISGFADLRTLYISLCEQLERFFEDMHDEEMDKNKLTFKHRQLELIEKEKPDNAGNAGYTVTVADLASLMESLQSCLLKYWEYEPATEKEEEDELTQDKTGDEQSSQVRQVDATKPSSVADYTKSKPTQTKCAGDEASAKPFKKRPIVFLMDEAHKLPALVNDRLSLKVFLDTLLVLTKQDRLCHVILSTSDSFFHHFLRSMNVGHHTQLLTIGDCSKDETRSYFDSTIQEMIPTHLQHKLSFEDVYKAFGGKLAHINDYVSSWVNGDGDLPVYQSAVFVQAYTLLQFHLTKTTFQTYSPLSVATAGTSSASDAATFTPEHLIHVMKKLVESPYSLPYFQLCREIGTNEVDSMIQTRILELRWTKSITPEDTAAEQAWCKDGIQRPVVLPMTRIVRRAMEVVLKEVGEAGDALSSADART
ncbi:hypothetical protein CERZMDRAFT_52939 [Cercospora zeae-maydis SCOH1-5]|uniref:ATPase domain-containing protein n=1 Tax=Cercospora zeae-maydis SCOH1-5 TaxID=717836 RepID=A0A6A6EZJ6_9PEZI|nr:hypothetical protein CERZMDRAFT_52939 [Cercospora zeae-maydis SCOH1-5]